ncbi:MAG: nucleotidyltransferase domain-containing protein [Planctomycetota bacterium]
MSAETLLDEVVARVRRVLRPEKIVLFGSRARGDSRPDSDYDLLVIQESDKPRYRRAGAAYAALADLPVEVMVYTPAEAGEWSDVPQAFVTTALREGKVLYEREG